MNEMTYNYYEYGNPCGCCGMRAGKELKRYALSNNRGIYVWPGDSGNITTEKVSLTTIQTKNGPLSISIRKVW